MAIAWFLCGYKLAPYDGQARRGRYCAMDDFTSQIFAEGGDWSETEVLGGYAIVKVRASEELLTTIAGTAGFQRIPAAFTQLDQTLGSLTTGQRTAILNTITAMGYTTAEISAALGSNLTGWRSRTLGQLLRFIASRRLKPRWDNDLKQIVLDGPVQECLSVDTVNARVQ